LLDKLVSDYAAHARNFFAHAQNTLHEQNYTRSTAQCIAEEGSASESPFP
jgi:hypothetical protein